MSAPLLVRLLMRAGYVLLVMLVSRSGPVCPACGLRMRRGGSRAWTTMTRSSTSVWVMTTTGARASSWARPFAGRPVRC